MMPMNQKLGAFRAALLTGWIGLSAAGWLYARQKNIPLWAALPIIAAFLLEYSFYLVPGFEPVRAWLRAHINRLQLALALAISAAAPYFVYSIPTGQFRWTACATLVALIAAVSLWYLALRPSPVFDILFLALLVAIRLSRLLDHIYSSPVPVRIDVLGKVMLIRTAALAVLVLRGLDGFKFGFVPTQQEWIAGVQYFFYFVPVGFPLALWLGVAHLTFTGFLFWKALALFFGALWIVALSEEFFFRGLLQQWLANWTRRPYLALAVASLLFGAAHLPFPAFPNWKMAAVAAIAGWFYGMAYYKTASIRSSMVTHALVVTVWRTLFS